MKALVTGSAGFIGSSIVAELLREGYDVIGIDSITDYYDVALKQKNINRNTSPKYNFVHGDLNTLDLAAVTQDVSYVFHQAGQPGVRKSWGTDFATYSVENVNATQRLLESLRDIPTLKRVVYASSSSVYGDAETYPTKESDRPEPISPYGVTKLAAEHLCTLYGKNFGIPTTSLRYFTVYGPRQRPDMAFTRFLNAALHDTRITLYGSGEQIRDFTYIDDVVSANIRASRSDLPGGDVYNVAGGSNVSVVEVLNEIQSLVSRSLKIDFVDKVAGDVKRTGGSTRAIEKALDWAPKVTLEEGIRMQYSWVKESASAT